MANIRKRGNSYQIRVSTGYTTDGRQVTQTMTWKPDPNMTARQIENELKRQEILFEERCSKGVVTTNVKFQEFAERWLDEYAAVNLKGTSFHRMKSASIRIYEHFGYMRLDKITRRHIQMFIDDLAKNGTNMHNGEPLSRKSVIHHLNFLSDVFNYAVRLDILEDNPCKNVVVPKGEKKEKAVYTVEEIEQLFEILERSPLKYKAFFTLAVYSGFRRGELLGLEWKDVDFENNIISVNRTSNYTVERGNYTDTPKTKKSVRCLKLPSKVFEILMALKDEQDRLKAKIGNKWQDSGRLFTGDTGAPMGCCVPYKWLKKTCESNDLRFCDIHSLRHFNASALISQGVDAPTVSAALGHSTVGTTTDIYCHLFAQAKAKTCDAIAAALDFTARQSKIPQTTLPNE